MKIKQILAWKLPLYGISVGAALETVVVMTLILLLYKYAVIPSFNDEVPIVIQLATVVLTILSGMTVLMRDAAKNGNQRGEK